MSGRYGDRVQQLCDRVLGATGRLGPLARRAAAGLGPSADLPPGTSAYLSKVRSQAWTIVDADVSALKSAGLDEDAIYDLTVAAAFGEGWRRLERGLAAHAEARKARRAP